MREIYDDLLARPNVRGVYVGRKRKDGRLTRSISVVCCVREKAARAKLSKKQRVPPEITWSTARGRPVKLSTDVQLMGPTTTLQDPPVLGPADRVSPQPGTVGIVLRHPQFGRVVTTAGHAFQTSKGTFDQDRPVSFVNVAPGGSGQTFTGRLRRTAIEDLTDYALIQPSAGVEAENQFHDRWVLFGVFHPPHPSDVNKTLFVLRADGSNPTILRGVGADVLIGGFRRHEALLTERATIQGDSGCCLVDEDLRVWGLLVGTAFLDGTRYSVFQSPIWLLRAENAEFE